MVSNASAATAEAPHLPDPFKIVSIRAVAAPPGTVGTNWHRYEISQGDNRIVGYRAGATGPVREAVELIVVGRRDPDDWYQFRGPESCEAAAPVALPQSQA